MIQSVDGCDLGESVFGMFKDGAIVIQTEKTEPLNETKEIKTLSLNSPKKIRKKDKYKKDSEKANKEGKSKKDSMEVSGEKVLLKGRWRRLNRPSSPPLSSEPPNPVGGPPISPVPSPLAALPTPPEPPVRLGKELVHQELKVSFYDYGGKLPILRHVETVNIEGRSEHALLDSKASVLRDLLRKERGTTGMLEMELVAVKQLLAEERKRREALEKYVEMLQAKLISVGVTAMPTLELEENDILPALPPLPPELEIPEPPSEDLPPPVPPRDPSPSPPSRPLSIQWPPATFQPVHNSLSVSPTTGIAGSTSARASSPVNTNKGLMTPIRSSPLNPSPTPVASPPTSTRPIPSIPQPAVPLSFPTPSPLPPHLLSSAPKPPSTTTALSPERNSLPPIPASTSPRHVVSSVPSLKKQNSTGCMGSAEQLNGAIARLNRSGSSLIAAAYHSSGQSPPTGDM